ncbi:glycosyltransferase [Kiloniella laminariae]|uniref:Glycosyltransferase n=1 Tax=Kiloniella laminariae TaxID=454162 RepID=A0ABT4LEQ3_9PROT|nr:glycosyltransferase [Kiloniella laminariae]MCZ4279564.1 glycosyltransferase [Kiloniella laminariae]
MRILLVMGAGGEGGAETFFTQLALALHRAGVETQAVIGPNEQRFSTLRSNGIETLVLPFRQILDFKTKPGLKARIKQYHPDVVLTFMNRASKLCPKGDFLHVARLGGYYKLKNYKNCDHLIGNTKDIVRYLDQAGWPEGRAHHVPNFASVDRDALPVSRAELDTPEDVPLIVSLGRLHENKAFDILLQAAKLENRPYIWIAGEGPLRVELEQMARDLDVAHRVRFLGWRNDRGALLATADFCVFPSRFEPFGSVMIEAWAMKCPLITTRTAGPLEIATADKDALMVPVDDAEAMAVAMTRVIDEKGLAEGLVKAGWDSYEKAYTEEACVQNYIDLFTRLLAEREQVFR